jgi:hypothetical protein
MAAMRAENDVIGSQMGANADGDRLLADVGVTGAMDQPALVRAGQLFLALTDQLHLPIQLQQ